MPLTIAECHAEDLPALSGLYRHLNPDDLPCAPDLAAAGLAQLHRWPGCAVLLGWLEGVLVASCTLVVIPNLTRGGDPYALIETVVTHGAYRRQGAGKAILAAAVAAPGLMGVTR